MWRKKFGKAKRWNNNMNIGSKIKYIIYNELIGIAKEDIKAGDAVTIKINKRNGNISVIPLSYKKSDKLKKKII